jgi:anaerobic ribonucleoside-triphosphate reductase activating protein
MNMISVADIYFGSLVDGDGIRDIVFGAGCSHRCEKCHNPQTWDINNGSWVTVQEVFDKLDLTKNPLLDGVTFSGGDPMYQPKAFCELAKKIKEVPKMDIWCYTGYTFEEIVNCKDEKYELLKQVNVLVDGKFVKELRDLSLLYRGSSNQRIIDVQESLKQNRVIIAI